MARVAILLSTFNGGATVEAQLDSILAQEQVTVEVFVRDDGSTDDTIERVKTYTKYWPRLLNTIGNVHLGITASYLTLLRSAPDNFDGYAFCDQDDVWLPDKLVRAMTKLANSETYRPTMYCSAATCVDSELRPLGDIWLGDDTRFEHLLFENTTFGATSVLNPAARALISEYTPEPRRLAPDWWCALCVAAFGDIICDRTPTILYRQHQNNTTGAHPRYMENLFRQLPRFLADPAGFFNIHAQALEFERLYGNRLSADSRRALGALTRSKRSLTNRIGYALFGRVVRRDPLRALAVRLLIAAGLY